MGGGEVKKKKKKKKKKKTMTVSIPIFGRRREQSNFGYNVSAVDLFKRKSFEYIYINMNKYEENELFQEFLSKKREKKTYFDKNHNKITHAQPQPKESSDLETKLIKKNQSERQNKSKKVSLSGVF